jgi:hypothetical protein
LPAVDALTRELASVTEVWDDGRALDSAMDRLQVALAGVNDAVNAAFVRGVV